MANNRNKLREHTPLLLACLVSLVLLSIAFYLKWIDSKVLGLETKWLVVSILPILLALIAGRYIGKFKGAGFEFEQDLQYVAPSPNTSGKNLNVDRSEDRNKLYEKNRNVFIVHKYKPSEHKGQRFDISIYLVKHGSNDLSDIAKAEFYFGKYWGDKVFEAEKSGGLMGVSTSAYGTFLATCLVTFTDDYEVTLYRYIDFEMASGDI